ncbi:MAG: hypothetical protein ACYCW6_03275 [Candidatus Xenobia bacterium]
MNRVCVSSIARPTALPRKAAAEQPPFWAGALQLLGDVWGGGSAVLATLSGYSDRFPAGGVTINPTGFIRNPEWTAHFETGQPLRDALPIVACFAAGITAARGSVELAHGMRLAGSIDMLLALTSALQIGSPGLAGAASLALAATRIALDATGSTR